MVEQLGDILRNLVVFEGDRVTLEWNPDGLEVMMYQDAVGVGEVVTGPVAGAIMEEIVTRAKLNIRAKGSFQATIGDEQIKFIVREYDHFGETAFEIRVRS